MRSGCPHRHGEAKSVFQHWSNVGPLPSSQDIVVTPVPVVHPENEIQNDMVATQYPGELRMTYSPAPLQQGYAQSQQHFQGLHHQQESQASIVSTRFQQPIPWDSARTSGRSHHQIGSLGNASSAHSAQYSSYFGASSSEKTIANIEHYKGQQVKGSLPALTCGETRRKKLDHSRGTPSTPHQQHVSSTCLSSQPSTDKVLPVRETQPLTDVQLQARLAKMIAYFGNYGHSNKERDRDSTLHSDYIMPKVDRVANLPTTSGSDKENVESQSLNSAVIEQYTATDGQAVEEDSSKGSKANAELTPKSKEAGDCTTSAPEKHSSEYPRIMMNINDSALKPVEPVGFTGVQGATDVSEGLQTKSSSVVSKNKTFELASLIESQDGNAHSGVTCNEVIARSKLNSSVDKIQSHNVVSIPASQSKWPSYKTNCEGTREDTGTVHSQTDVSLALYENEAKKHAPLSQSKEEEGHSVVKLVQYADSSDDTSQMATKLPNTEHEELSFPPCSEDPLYENISEDENPAFSEDPLYENISEDGSPACSKDPLYENISEDERPQIEYMAMDTSSPTQVPEPNDKQSPFEKEGNGHVQGQARMETVVISDDELIPKKQVSLKTETFDIAQHCSCKCFVETDDGFECQLCLKCDPQRRTNHSDEDETDDQTDDDWLVIPISIADLKDANEDEDQDSPKNIVLHGGKTGDQEIKCDTSPTHWSSPKLAIASDSSQMEVFDTMFECCTRYGLQVNTVQIKDGFEVTSGRRTPDDTSEIDDSHDYSSVSEHNYLTASSKLLEKRRTDVSVSEKECDGNEVTNMQKGRARSLDMQPNIITVSDSDTEDESDQNCKKNEKRKRLFSSSSEDSGDAACSQQKRLSSENVGSQCGKQHKTNRQNSATGKSAPIIISDTEDEDDNDSGNASCVEQKTQSDYGNTPFAAQKRQSPETVDSEYDTAEEKLQETRLSYADSPLPQHQSKLQFDEVMHDACSDRSHSTEKSGQLIEAKGGSVHVRHKTNSQPTSKGRAKHDSDKVVKKKHFSKKKVKRIHSSGSEDSSDASFATENRPSTKTVGHLCGTANKNPRKSRPSTEDSPEKQPHTVDEEPDPTLVPNPVIPCFVVLEPSQPNGYLKLLKENRVHRHGKDETFSPKTSTASSKKTDSCEKNEPHMYINKKATFVPTPKPASDGHPATKKVQANVTKPRMVSRQLSSSSQEGPSTSLSSLSSTTGQLSEVRKSTVYSRDLSESGETSTSPSRLASKQTTSIPRQHLSSSKLQRSLSCSNPSTLNDPHTLTKAPSSASMQSSARNQVTKEWNDSFVPTKLDRKTSLVREKKRRTTIDSLREAKPGPSFHNRAPRRPRQNSHDSATPLVKKSKMVAIQRTKDIHQDAPGEQRCSVGQGYKWSEKPTVAKPTKGFGDGKRF